MNNWLEITTSYGSKKLVNMDTGSSVEEDSNGNASLCFIGGAYGTTMTSIKETYQEMKDLLGVTKAQEQQRAFLRQQQIKEQEEENRIKGFRLK